MLGKMLRFLKKTESHDGLIPLAVPQETSEIVDRMEGCVLLGASGDAMGYAVEFKQVDEIVQSFNGPVSFSDPLRWRHRGHGYMVSDDTQMTMFGMEAIARSIEEHPDDYCSVLIDEIRRSYIEWYGTQGRLAVSSSGPGLLSYREMFAARAPGNTCLEALRIGGNGSVHRPINDSKGCGGVMRVAPLAFIPGVDEDALWSLSTASAALTHGHVLGWASAGALALVIRKIVMGMSIREAVTASVVDMRRNRSCPEMAEVLERSLVYAGRREMKTDQIEALGGGWVGEECLLIGTVAALMDADVPSRMGVAVNHGGDSDSTACVAGQLMGAHYGRKRLENMHSIGDIFRDLDVARPLSYVMNRFGKAIHQS
ncbi:ADP-ribosylglycohydrolase family protein [Agrobacterium rubi]|nr:ADP-ribosylglycohydrolase family protein [Agrobacterium rubi]NTF23988.1 ADP-ribosylglycohydrolase family protein [Agrobacterium rubi]